MRRSRCGSKTANGQSSTSHIILLRVGYAESTLKVREGCVSRVDPKANEGSVPYHGDKLRVTGQGPKGRRSLYRENPKSQ
eukprot:1835417-Pleurochrysis_carterae.AAC.1